MPEMDGVEAARRMNSVLDMNRKPVIIAVTANAMAGDREKYLNCGMDDYMSKPIILDALEKILIKWGKGKRENETVNRKRNSGIPLIDSTAIDNLKSISEAEDNGFIKEIIGLFLEQLPGLVDDIKGFLNDKDTEKFIRTSHALKGASLNVGAKALGEHAKLMEKTGSKGKLESAGDLIKELEILAGRTRTELGSYLNNLN